MKKNLPLILRYLIGLVFLVSAYSKLISPGIVEIILVDHGIAGSRETAALFVRLLVGFEFALGLLFFQPNLLKKFVLPASLLFLFAFSVYLIYTGYILGDNQNCGCFGSMIEMLPLESIIKNIFLIAGILWLYKLIKEDGNKIVLPLIFLVVSVAAVFIISPVKSEKDSKFSGYTNFIGKGRVDLSDGKVILAVYNTECEHCQELAKEINVLSKTSKNFPKYYSLFFSEGEISIDSFKVITGYDFPYQIIDARTFFDLIGTSPPRIYLLENGVVKETWDMDFVEKFEKKFSME
jgi:hypothetical protein